jgi:hypothetical protein
MTKPFSFPEFAQRTQCLVDFWLSNVAVLPSKIGAHGSPDLAATTGRS